MSHSLARRNFHVGQDVVMRSNQMLYGHVVGFERDGSVMVQWAGGRVVTGVSQRNLKVVPRGWAGKQIAR